MSTTLSQEQKAVQRQIATQQTIRLMQLVELPYTSLEQEILKEVDENPALETYDEDVDEHGQTTEETPEPEYDENGVPLELSDNPLPEDEIFKEDYYRDDDIDDYPSEREIENSIQRLNAPDLSDRKEPLGVFTRSLQEDWMIQLGEMEIAGKQYDIARYLVGCLDEKGYCVTDLQSVANELLYTQNIYTSVDEVEQVLTQFVQELDPAGTGARNTQECLLIQLHRVPNPDATTKLAIRIIENSFDALSRKHYDKICQLLGVTPAELKAALNVIMKLDPRPADSASDIEKTSGYINPDFIISSDGVKLTLTLNNQYVPKVRINKEFSNEYRFMTRDAREKKREEAEKFMREYVDRANQFIGTLSTREMILYNTMYAIMRRQERYFLTGDDAELKPMILKNIAEEVNLDVSTVSRVSNSKYVQTDFGTIPLKHLFSEAVNDEDVSSKEIKSILSQVIAEEDKKTPLSDEKLCGILKDKNYDIARRTVAKYREQLGIPVARLRKEL